MGNNQAYLQIKDDIETITIKPESRIDAFNLTFKCFKAALENQFKSNDPTFTSIIEEKILELSTDKLSNFIYNYIAFIEFQVEAKKNLMVPSLEILLVIITVMHKNNLFSILQKEGNNKMKLEYLPPFNLVILLLYILTDDIFCDVSYGFIQSEIQYYFIAFNSVACFRILIESSIVDILKAPSLNFPLVYASTKFPSVSISKFLYKTFFNFKLSLSSVITHNIDNAIYSNGYTEINYLEFIHGNLKILLYFMYNPSLVFLQQTPEIQNLILEIPIADSILASSNTLADSTQDSISKFKKLIVDSQSNNLWLFKQILISNYNHLNDIFDYLYNSKSLSNTSSILTKNFLIFSFSQIPELAENVCLKSEKIIYFLSAFQDSNVYDIYILYLLTRTTNFLNIYCSIDYIKLHYALNYKFSYSSGFLGFSTRYYSIDNNTKEDKIHYLLCKITSFIEDNTQLQFPIKFLLMETTIQLYSKYLYY